MSNEYRDKLLSVGVISKRSKDRVVEGRKHPESGLPYKTVTDQNGATVTEHSKPGTAVAARQDVHLRPEQVSLKSAVQTNQES